MKLEQKGYKMTMAVSDNKTHELLIKLCEKLSTEKQLQDKLDRTKKQLEIAVDALKWIDETYNLGMGYEAAIMEKCELALEEITALEQKDK